MCFHPSTKTCKTVSIEVEGSARYIPILVSWNQPRQAPAGWEKTIIEAPTNRFIGVCLRMRCPQIGVSSTSQKRKMQICCILLYAFSDQSQLDK